MTEYNLDMKLTPWQCNQHLNLYQACLIFSRLLITFVILLPDMYKCQNFGPDFKISKSREYGAISLVKIK